MKTPKWLENAIFYEIYPQSYYDSNNEGIGDLKGIIEKLDYIKSLGCNALWLNPIFASPFKDAGYDVSDYYSIAPRYGTMDDLMQLIDEVHKRDMHILLDLVPCHTSDEHPWFKESSKQERNEYSSRYIWTNSAFEKPWNGLQAVGGVAENLRGVKKFADMGLVPGAEVEYEGSAPFGGLIRIKLMDTSLSLRADDARHFWVRVMEEPCKK